MNPNFITGLAFASPTADQAALLMQDVASPSATTEDLGFASICISRTQHAQGTVLRRYRDGRISIDAGGRVVTGYPVSMSGKSGFWARLSGLMF